MMPPKSFKTLLLKKPFCTFLLGLLLLAGCAKIDLYEKIVPIPGQAWQSSFQPSFQFQIEDTSTAYQLFLILRHNNMYGYNNIWLNVHRKSPDGKVSTVPYELQLATNDKGWLGEGMDDLYAYRMKRPAAAWLLWAGLGIVGGHRFYAQRHVYVYGGANHARRPAAAYDECRPAH